MRNLMFISQKNRYALRAVFELAKRRKSGFTKVADIARTQGIPSRFLEVILSQLKQGGFVESRRGSEGGYHLVPAPAELTVGEILGFLQGNSSPVDAPHKGKNLPSSETYAFQPLWDELWQAVSRVLASRNFEDLLEQEASGNGGCIANYNI